MYKPYAKPVLTARADVKLPEPVISKFVFFLLKGLGRLYLFLFYGIARILLRGEKELFDSFKRALAGDSRCIIAFRHPNGGEPQLLAWFFLFRLRTLAARQGVIFCKQPHAHMIYGYEVARWGGWVARFVLPYVGAMPVHHSKIDRQGMKRIYDAIYKGMYPIALAPEGQVSYTTDTIPHIEQGAIRIGFHAAEVLNNNEKKIPLEVLPVSVHARFGKWGRYTMEKLLKKTEKYSLIRPNKETKKLSFSMRVERCRDHILEINEQRYQINADKSLPFEKRLDAVIDAALEKAENILGVKTSGDFFSRMYSLRQTCWDRIILPGVDTLDTMTKAERGTYDLRAGEAWYASRHVELIDFSWYFRVPIPADDVALHYKVEYVQNLWDFINRSIGGAYSNRINILPRKVIIQCAPPINLSERLPSYRQDRAETIQKTMTDLENAYLDCIDKVNKSVLNQEIPGN